jgi:tRNA pseudouridine55 synthase
MEAAMFGLLNLNKPVGITSREAVDFVERLVRPARCGHAGTLDPLASGVLVVCIGPATRLIKFAQRMPKRYRATFVLGRRSPTDDIESPAKLLSDPPIPSQQAIEAACRSLVGQIEQRPPAYSAVKVAGRRAYSLARAGRPVELAPRLVTVHRLELTAYAYPEVTLDIQCGAGTYVRSLGRDLAESLGTAAVMTAMERTAVGNFHIDAAIDPTTLSLQQVFEALAPPLAAVADLPRVELSDAEVAELAQGRFIAPPIRSAALGSEPTADQPAAGEIVGVNAAGRLVAILRRRPDGRLGANPNFAHLLQAEK